MPSKVYSAAVVGVEAFEVEIEVDAGWGNPDKIAVVGLPDTAVKESRDRVTSAIGNSGLRWPGGKRMTINLDPGFTFCFLGLCTFASPRFKSSVLLQECERYIPGRSIALLGDD